MLKKNNTFRIGVFGHGHSNHLTESILDWVKKFGKIVSESGCTLYTGGGGGIMHAARQGSLEGVGNIISVCPEMDFSSEDIVNDSLGNIIASGQGKLGRVHLLTQSIDIGFALGGGAGTLLEIIACYLLAKPIIVVNGFQKKSDPSLIKLLNKVKTKSFLGHTIQTGYIDGKDSSQVFPVHICDCKLAPSTVFELGISILEEGISSKHKM